MLLILCDIGNTTLDYLIHNERQTFFMGQPLPYITETVFFISVNQTIMKEFQQACPNNINLENSIDLPSDYTGLGVDRKIACLNQKDAIIIDAGSAITVDSLSKEGYHEGGFILPGLYSLEQSYKRIASQLDVDINPKVNLDTIPTNTVDAISYAIIHSIVLPIQNIAFSKKEIIFTGGDGLRLSQYIKRSRYYPSLIFDNMKEIIRANHRSA